MSASRSSCERPEVSHHVVPAADLREDHQPPDTRKTGLPPGLPYIGVVSAEPNPVRAVYRAAGRIPRPARLFARACARSERHRERHAWRWRWPSATCRLRRPERRGRSRESRGDRSRARPHRSIDWRAPCRMSLASFANRDDARGPGIPAGSGAGRPRSSRYLEVARAARRRGLLEIEMPGRARTGDARSSSCSRSPVRGTRARSTRTARSRAQLQPGPRAARLLLAALAALADETGVVDELSTDELCRAAGLANSTYRRARRRCSPPARSRSTTTAAAAGGRVAGGLATASGSPTSPVSDRTAASPAARCTATPAASDRAEAGAESVRTPERGLWHAGKGPDPERGFRDEGSDPERGFVGKGPDLSGVSGETPPKPRQKPRHPTRAREGNPEPRNQRTPPTPLKGGGPPRLILEESYSATEGGVGDDRFASTSMSPARTRFPTADRAR